jgi:hypothetical protein
MSCTARRLGDLLPANPTRADEHAPLEREA